MSDLALPVPARPLGGRELQFLREASNSKGRAAGHNNTMVIALERDGLVTPVNHGLYEQSNYHTTSLGKIRLEAHREGNEPMTQDWADAATLGILDNLMGRKGIGNELECMDNDVRAELAADIADVIRKAAASTTVSAGCQPIATNWQPAETSLKQGDKLLGYGTYFRDGVVPEQAMAFWNKRHKCWMTEESWHVFRLTHWMDLPKPPHGMPSSWTYLPKPPHGMPSMLLNHECAEDEADPAAVVGGEAVAALSSAGFAVVPFSPTDLALGEIMATTGCACSNTAWDALNCALNWMGSNKKPSNADALARLGKGDITLDEFRSASQEEENICLKAMPIGPANLNPSGND